MSNNLNLGDLKITLTTFEDEPISAKFELPDGNIVTRPFPGTGELTMKLGLGLGLSHVQSGGSSASAPTNTGLPVISGTPTVGQILSTTNGTWDDGGAEISGYTYQWKADGVDISGATASTYELTSDEVGDNITVTVTATNSAGSTPATSGAVGPVEAKAIAFTDNDFLVATQSSYTFSAKSIGTPSASRKVIVGFSCSAVTVNSVLIGGVSATLLKAQTAGASTSQLWIADVPTGTTADITINLAATSGSMMVGVWSATGLASSTPVDTDGAVCNTGVALTTANGGFVVGFGRHSSSTGMTWSNMTERYDQVVVSTLRHTGADVATTGSSLSVNCSGSSVNANSPYAVASF